MKKRLPVLLHVLLWLALLAFSLFTHFNLGPLKAIPVHWLVLDVVQTFTFHLALFYFNWFVLVPKVLAKGNVLFYALAVIATLTLYSAVRAPIDIYEKKKLAEVDKSMAEQLRKYPQSGEFAYVMFQLAITGVMNIFLSSSLRVTGDYLRNERRRKELEHQHTTTELELLKSQVNPHFLFNTLNNIYSLAYQNAPSTPDAIMKLSLLLRYQLYETNSPLVPLEKEVEHLQHLLDLHKLRLPSPELLSIEVEGDVSRMQVPPMLLMPLVENMFKHGLTTAPMHVLVAVQQSQLVFSTSNTLKPNATPAAYGGIGLQNLQRRLELLYPGAFTLETSSVNSLFKARLVLTHLS
ncbi:sensor histidine kinase [Rufibacter sp. LB8]|uniref:sensor histidine kinase n=1 Tax=Rufibacter sp. LB8 TaxID=2777781 RepID=UPI00178C50BA|nr:histidine kinase [Rufibacter sp. LB8]